MTRHIYSFRTSLNNLHTAIMTNRGVVLLVAAIGSPIAYIYWSYIEPQPYESIFLRAMTVITTLPIAFFRQLPTSSIKYQSAYLFLIVIFNSAFLFSFMLFMNEYSQMWQLSFLLSLLLSMMLIRDWFLVFIIYLIGVTCSFITYAAVTPQVIWPSNLLGLAFVFGFAFIVGSLIIAYNPRYSKNL